jgi:RimJ/RimL family protein N-acetyltransferase
MRSSPYADQPPRDVRIRTVGPWRIDAGTLGGMSVRLEPWGEDDLGLLQRLMGDPEMMEYLGGPESGDQLATRQNRYAQPGSGMFKIIDEPSGVAVGSVGYWEKSWRGESIYETGWSVLPEFQGRGLAAAATAFVIELARAERQHRFLHAFPSIANAASNAICRKLGFELLGESDFEYPPCNVMRCNDWRLDLWAGQP